MSVYKGCVYMLCVCVLYYNVQLLVQVNKVFVLFCFVKPNLKALTINVETTVVYTGIPYSTVYGWNRPTVKARCWLFTYISCP